MSCGCGSTPYADYGYNGLCRQDLPYPQVSHESVPSLIDNLVTALYGGFYDPAANTNSGGIIKNVVNGRVVWKVPCDPSNVTYQFPKVPPNPGEGVLCYILRIFGQYVVNEVTNTNTINLYNKTLVAPSLTGSISCNSLASQDTLNPVTLSAASLSGALSIIGSDSLNVPTLGSSAYTTAAYLINTSISGGSSTNRTIASATLPGASLSAVTISGNSSLSFGTSSITLPASCVGSSQIVNGAVQSQDMIGGSGSSSLLSGGFAFDASGNWTIPAATLSGGSLSGAKHVGGALTGAVDFTGLTGSTGVFSNCTFNGGSVATSALSADTFSGAITATGATFTGGTFNSPGFGGTATGSLTSGVVTGLTTSLDTYTQGFVGEWQKSSVALASAVTPVTNTAVTITSVQLTAGDWDVSGCINLNLTSCSLTSVKGGISSATNNITTPTGSFDTFVSFVSTSVATAQTTSTIDLSLATKPCRVALTTSATLYLVVLATFTGAGSLKAYGTIEARRVR